jgi:CRP-like cAMP-binding protein
MGELFSSLLLPIAVGAVASTVPDDAQMKVSLGSVIGSLVVGIIATLSLPLGAALGIYLNVSKKFVAIVMAFGAGALIQALAVELAFGSAEHLIVAEKMQWGIGWLWVAMGFTVGGLVYSGANLALDNIGGAMRKAATARAYVRRLRREKATDMLVQLSASDLFRSLPAGDLVKLIHHAETRRMSKGDVIYKGTDISDGVYLIEQGHVKFEPTAPGGMDGSYGPGHCFGELELLTREARQETAVAQDEVQLMFIPADDFNAVMAASPLLQSAVDELIMVHTHGNFNIDHHLRQQTRNFDQAKWLSAGVEAVHVTHEEAAHHESEESHGSPLAIFMGVLLDGIPEAIVLGAAFTSWATFNPTFLAAVFMANVPEAWASSAHMKRSGYTPSRIFYMWGGLVFACAVFSVVGNLFLATASPTTIVFVEAFAGGGVMAMVAQTMLPHAFEDGGAPVGMATIFGFLAAFVFTAQSLGAAGH